MVVVSLFSGIECLYFAYHIVLFFEEWDNLFWMHLDHVAGSYIANQTRFSEKNQQIQTSSDGIT